MLRKVLMPRQLPCRMHDERVSPNDKGGKLYDPPPKLVELCRPLHPMAFNDLYCLARPHVHTLSIGAVRPTDFDVHAQAVGLLEGAADAIGPIERRLCAEMENALGRDWCESWHEGVPDYDAVPGCVNVSEILRLWTYAKSLDLTAWGKMRYNLLGGGGGHWFPGEMADKADDGALRAALGGHPLADRIPGILREAHTLLFDAPSRRDSEG